MSTPILTSPTERIALNRLLWVAPLAIIASVTANLVLFFVADALFGVAWEPMFSVAPVTGASVAYLLIATFVFAAVGRFAKRPIWLYQRIALAALVLSFFTPVSALLGMAAPPGAAASPAPLDTFVVMILMHIVAYAISTPMFTRLARAA
ncbi:MAG: hypothetical protein ACRDH2_00050 [Anaerolineales bacterium]